MGNNKKYIAYFLEVMACLGANAGVAHKFTLEAEQFAQDKPIELIDSHRLVDYIHLAKEAKTGK